MLLFGVSGLITGWITAALALLGLRRRPRLRAWLFAEETEVGLHEGYMVEAVVGRRPVEVTEIGMLFIYGPRKHRQHLHLRGRPNRALPAHLSDGESVWTSFELDGLIETLLTRIGEEERLRSDARAYVRASGTEYSAPIGGRFPTVSGALSGLRR